MGRGRNGLAQSKRMASIANKTRRKYTEKKTGPGKINDPNRIRPKGATHLRDRSTIKRLKMYNDKAIRDKKGRIIQQRFMRYDTDEPVSRIHPDRRWFGNTKVISQKQLQLFQQEMTKSIHDPFQIVLKTKKLPYGLIADITQNSNNTINKINKNISKESFVHTFGPKFRQKKPKLKANSLESFAKRAITKQGIMYIYIIYIFLMHQQNK